MTKEQKIKEAYGEYYEFMQKELDENGWCSVYNHTVHWEMSKFYEIETRAYGVGTSWRPKSLKGIDDNNGWTKI